MTIAALLLLLSASFAPSPVHAATTHHHWNTDRIRSSHTTNAHYRHHLTGAAQPAETTAAPVVSTTANSATVATDPTDFSSQVEQLIFTKINIERSKNNLAALNYDATLATVARAHSADMADKNYFSHDDPNGCSSACRITNAGYTWSAVGENIFMMTGYHLTADETAQMIVDGWMNSPGHRANILNGSFTNEGIGVVQSGNSLYATEDFALPR